MSDTRITHYQPEESYEIKTLDALKVISDEKRLQILEVLADKPSTVKEMAFKLGLAPTKLYYHIKLLEEHGFIVVVDTQIVSGIIEKTYGTRALSYSVDPDLLAVSQTSIEAAVDLIFAVFDKTKTDMKRSMQAGLFNPKGEQAEKMGQAGTMAQKRVYLTREQAEDVQRQINEIFAQLPSENDQKGNPDALPYNLLMIYYPTLPDSSEV